MGFYFDMYVNVEKKYEEYAPIIKDFKTEAGCKEVAIFGRSGQGIWTTGELLCAIMIKKGKHAKTQFHMGGERQLGLGRQYVRYADKPVVFPVSFLYSADIVLLLDPSIANLDSTITGFSVPTFFKRLEKDATIIVNSSKKPKDLQLDTPARIATVDATTIAIEVFNNPLRVNTAGIGALIALTHVVEMAELESVFADFQNPRGLEIFKGALGEKNIKAAQMGYEGFKI
jgi:pyruvate ferredoxin oxidoreductase gamma subunit